MEQPQRNGHDHDGDEQPIVELETRVVRVDGKTRLFVSADDCLKVLQSIDGNLERTSKDHPEVRAQLALIREITAQLLTAIATVDTNGYDQ